MTFKRPISVSPLDEPPKKTCTEQDSSTRCQVCGDKAHIFNYGALSCASCKTFFRRHGFHPKNSFQCDFYGNCEITVQSRRMCTACRFTKCLAVGMSPDLIRKEDLTGKSRSSATAKPKHNVSTLPITSTAPLTPLNLLSNDTSSLSPSNWTLLSNVVHAFDTYSPVSQVQRMLDYLTCMPDGFQVNMEQGKVIICSICQSFQLSMSATADFRIMTTEEQCSLVYRTWPGISAFYSLFICLQCNLFGNEANKNILKPLYGSESIEYSQAVSLRIDHDLTLVKLILMVLSFSSNCFEIDAARRTPRDSLLFGTFRLFGSQNVYVEVMWKYMLYRYGYFESAKRFCALIKVMLDEINLASAVYKCNKDHFDLANLLAEQMTRSLILHGNENIPLWGKTVN